jgi:septal ring factor EnvC (AmiA/AmiB activator)
MAAYTWEPWRERHKISPLGQRIEPVKELASTLAKRQREAQWHRSERERRRAEAQRRRQAERLEARPNPDPPEPDNPAPKRAKIDFPDDF